MRLDIKPSVNYLRALPRFSSWFLPPPFWADCQRRCANCTAWQNQDPWYVANDDGHDEEILLGHAQVYVCTVPNLRTTYSSGVSFLLWLDEHLVTSCFYPYKPENPILFFCTKRKARREYIKGNWPMALSTCRKHLLISVPIWRPFPPPNGPTSSIVQWGRFWIIGKRGLNELVRNRENPRSGSTFTRVFRRKTKTWLVV